MSQSSGDLAGIGYCKGSRLEKMALLESKQKGNKTLLAPEKPMKKSKSADILERMTMLEQAMTKHNFVKVLDKAMDKDHPEYGRPQDGTRTAERGKKAHSHVHKEILELCEVIYMNGFEVESSSVMLFGDLFKLYTRISDKVVGILLRAKKYGLVYFEPEMLFQGRDDDEPVFLARPMKEIYKEFNKNKKFVMEESDQKQQEESSSAPDQ